MNNQFQPKYLPLVNFLGLAFIYILLQIIFLQRVGKTLHIYHLSRFILRVDFILTSMIDEIDNYDHLIYLA